MNNLDKAIPRRYYIKLRTKSSEPNKIIINLKHTQFKGRKNSYITTIITCIFYSCFLNRKQLIREKKETQVVMIIVIIFFCSHSYSICMLSRLVFVYEYNIYLVSGIYVIIVRYGSQMI